MFNPEAPEFFPISVREHLPTEELIGEILVPPFQVLASTSEEPRPDNSTPWCEIEDNKGESLGDLEAGNTAGLNIPKLPSGKKDGTAEGNEHLPQQKFSKHPRIRLVIKAKTIDGKSLSWYYERVCLPGTLVPSATNHRDGITAMVVTESLSPTEHPKAEATSPTMAVRTPIHTIDITKHSQAPNRSTS